MATAGIIQPLAYGRVGAVPRSCAINHQAVPKVIPANKQPLDAPKPEQPRPAQVIPPRTANKRQGRKKSSARERSLNPPLFGEAMTKLFSAKVAEFSNRRLPFVP